MTSSLRSWRGAPRRPRNSWGPRSRLVEGTLNLLEGNPDVGKTVMSIHVAACVSTGRPIHGDDRIREARSVLYFTSEDSVSQTVVPRLRAAGANLDRVLVQEPRGSALLLPDALDDLRRLIRKHRARLLVMDPLNGYLDASKINVNRDQEVRQALQPLRELAEEEKLTVLALRHLNKASDKPALYRGGGSIALAAVARSVLLVARHPNDETLRVIVVQKGNLAQDSKRKPVGFRVESHDSGHAVIEWEPGDIEIDAEELLAQRRPGPTPKTKDRAKEFLRAFLAAGPRLREDVVGAADAAGLNEKTLERAVRDLRIDSVPHDDDPKKRLWALPLASAH